MPCSSVLTHVKGEEGMRSEEESPHSSTTVEFGAAFPPYVALKRFEYLKIVIFTHIFSWKEDF